MITIQRNTLLTSINALNNLGAVQLPVEKDQYWLAKTFGKCVAKFNQESKLLQKTVNAIVEKYGEKMKDQDGNEVNRYHVPQGDIDAIAKVDDALEAFRTESITLEVQRIKMSALASAGIKLSLADQAALEWLLDSEA